MLELQNPRHEFFETLPTFSAKNCPFSDLSFAKFWSEVMCKMISSTYLINI